MLVQAQPTNATKAVSTQASHAAAAVAVVAAAAAAAAVAAAAGCVYPAPRNAMRCDVRNDAPVRRRRRTGQHRTRSRPPRPTCQAPTTLKDSMPSPGDLHVRVCRFGVPRGAMKEAAAPQRSRVHLAASDHQQPARSERCAGGGGGASVRSGPDLRELGEQPLAGQRPAIDRV